MNLGAQQIPGIVQAPVWDGALQTVEQLVLDIQPRVDALPWDVVVTPTDGVIELDVSYGGSARRTLTGLSTPFAVALPGSITIVARNVAAGRAAASVSVTAARAVGGFMRSALLTGPSAIQSGAYRYHAVTASTVNMSGNPIVLVAGDVLDISDPASLVAGIGWVEFAP